MKILFIAPAPPPPGGIESVTENLVNYLKANPNGIYLIHYNTSHRFRPVTNQSVSVRFLTGIVNSLQTFFKVLQIIRKEQPDIIHLASSSSLALIKDSLIIKAAKRSGIPVVMHWHFGRLPYLKIKNNWEWRLLQHVVRKSDVSIVIDQKSYETLIAEGFSNIVNIPNPLSFDIAKKARELFNTPVHRQQGRLIYVGHIIKSKGVYELVEACAKISKITELILIGPYERAVKNELVKIAALRFDSNWLHFAGELEINQVLEYMIHSPVLALPSYTEGFPMVIIEAMAMGCAIIASDVGAIPQVLAIGTHSPCGICIPPQNVEKLREAILKLMENHIELESFGKRGIDRVLAIYTIEKVFRQYCCIWEHVINNNKSCSTNSKEILYPDPNLSRQ